MSLANIFPIRFTTQPEEIRGLLLDSGITIVAAKDDPTVWTADIMYIGPASVSGMNPQPYRVYTEVEDGELRVKAKLLTHDGGVDHRYRAFPVWCWANRLEIGFAIPRIVDCVSLGG